MIVSRDVERVWLLALVAKCESMSVLNAVCLALVAVMTCIVMVWSHPGGPAWGNYYRWRKTSGPKIRGPRGLPIIGSMELMCGLAHQKLAAAARGCGGTRLMALSLGQTRAVVTCNPEVAKEILNSASFSDRPVKDSAYQLMFNRSIGFAPYGVYWTALRKMASQHLFCPNQVRASQEQRARIANQVVSLLSNQAGTPARLRDVFKLASLNNMMSSVFGREYHPASTEAAELHDLVEQGYHLLGLINWSDHLPFLADLDLQNIRHTCSRLVPRVNTFLARIVAQRMDAAPPARAADFLDVMLSLPLSQRLSDSDMIAVLWEMIFRGTDTVAVLMEWILARLVLHPDVQSKVHEELDKVVGRSRAVTESDLTELVYLTAVVKEVLRLHPPGPLLSWSRLSIRDSVVDGHHVPAGTTAMVNMWAIMTDPQVWADPLAFNPDRFLGATDFSVFGSDLRIAPFGSGRRSCPGKALGLTTVNFWVATLLQQFQFRSSGQSVDLSELLRLSCEMANPLVVNVQPRRPLSANSNS